MNPEAGVEEELLIVKLLWSFGQFASFRVLLIPLTQIARTSTLPLSGSFS